MMYKPWSGAGQMVIKKVRPARLIRPSVLDRIESINMSAPENNCPERT